MIPSASRRPHLPSSLLLLGGLLAATSLGCSKRPADVRSAEEAHATEYPEADPGTTAVERAVLQRVESLPVGVATKVESATVTAEETYLAASGSPCRPLRLDTGETVTLRLACKEDATWFFAAEVMAPAPESAAGPPAPNRAP